MPPRRTLLSPPSATCSAWNGKGHGESMLWTNRRRQLLCHTAFAGGLAASKMIRKP